MNIFTFKNFAVLLLMVFMYGCSFFERDNPVSTGTFDYGILTDSRDGRIYWTITIGSQTWMAENLNVGIQIDGLSDQTNNGIIEKYVYNNDEKNGEIYGGLYQWDEAMNYSIVEGSQGICPDGWHIPTDTDWTDLEIHLGMSPSEADSVGYRGTDQANKLKTEGSSGFRALYSGYRSNTGSFDYVGALTYFWSSMQYDSTSAWYRYINVNLDQVARHYYSNNKTEGFCVRCIRNN